jgi:hypothetical protein
MAVDLRAEAAALLDYLQGRSLSEAEACAVMGIALEGLIHDPAKQEEFLQILERNFAGSSKT